MRRKLATVFTFSFLITMALFTVPESAVAHFEGCVHHANNPHLSSGGPGVVAKSTINCDHSHHFLEMTLNLYICPDDYNGSGPPSEAWVGDNCYIKRDNYDAISPLEANIKYTRQVPKVGGDAVTGTGYWVQCTIFHMTHNGSEWLQVDTSYVVYLSA